MAKRVKRNTRKGKRSSRRRQQGGWQNLSPANLSAAQGTEYKDIHKGQYGGGMVPMEGAPVGTTGVLDESLRASARVTPLDDSVAAIQGMSDQSGGARRRGRRGSRRKNGANTGGSRRRRRRHSGGGDLSAAADYSAPTHLLSAGAEAKALMQQNPEWNLAKDPSSFAPKMYGGALPPSRMSGLTLVEMNNLRDMVAPIKELIAIAPQLKSLAAKVPVLNTRRVLKAPIPTAATPTKPPMSSVDTLTKSQDVQELDLDLGLEVPTITGKALPN